MYRVRAVNMQSMRSPVLWDSKGIIDVEGGQTLWTEGRQRHTPFFSEREKNTVSQPFPQFPETW